MGTRRLALAGLAAGLLLGLAACAAGTDEPPNAGGSVSVSPSDSAQPTPPASPPPSSLGPIGPPLTPSSGATGGKPTAEQTLTGVVIEGVEAGCMILRAAEGDYLLMAPATVDKTLIRAGNRLVVRGRVETGIVSSCQQGTPFMVSSMRLA